METVGTRAWEAGSAYVRDIRLFNERHDYGALSDALCSIARGEGGSRSENAGGGAQSIRTVADEKNADIPPHGRVGCRARSSRAVVVVDDSGGGL